MTKSEKTDIIKRHRACPNLTPYVTASGGVVIFNGPFPMKQANATKDFIEHAGHDIYTLLTEINRLEAIIAHMGIAQVLFFEGEQPDVSYADRAGKYQGQTGITLAKV